MRKPTKRRRPDVLAIERQADTIVQDDAEAIREGLDDVAHGRTLHAGRVFDEIRRKYAIPRSNDRVFRNSDPVFPGERPR
jgi:hypothetical protein